MKAQIEDKIESVKIGDKVKQITTKVRAHTKRNKKVYIAVSCGIVTGYILRGNSQPGFMMTTMRPLFLFSNHNKLLNIIAVIEPNGKGHPGFPVICKETGSLFPSQGKAALWAGVYPSLMSTHLAGKLDNAGGWHFERVSAIPAVLPTAT